MRKIPQIRRALTRSQRAEAAASNVAALDRQLLIQQVVDFILNTRRGRRSLPLPIRTALELRNAALRAPLSRMASGKPPAEFKAVRNHLLSLVSPSQNTRDVHWITSDWLPDRADARDRLDKHAEALVRLHGTHPHIYHALFDSKLDVAARLGTKAGLDQARLTNLLVDQARVLLISIAHDHVDHIRWLATRPTGRHFAGFTTWKSAGHVLLASVAEPALVVAEALTLSKTFLGNDDAARDVLARKKLLDAGPSGDFVWSAAVEVRTILRRPNFSETRLNRRLGTIANDIAPVSRLTNRDMTSEGLTDSSMSAFWFGLESTEAAAYVAIDLLKALGAVEAIVEAVLDCRSIKLRSTPPSKAKATFATTLLRAGGQPDREAGQLDTESGVDPGNKASRGPLVSLRSKLRDPTIAAAAARTFGIDPMILFRR